MEEEDEPHGLEVVAAKMKALEATQEGLSSTEAENRLIQFGFNELPDPSLSWRRYLPRLHHRDDPVESLLRKHIAPQQWTLRDGKKVLICSYDLVPGDVVLLRVGDSVHADVILLPDTDGGGRRKEDEKLLEVDQSYLTGETLPVAKFAGSKVFADSVVYKGECMAMVTETGTNTFFGNLYGSMPKERGRRQISKKCEKALAEQAEVLVLRPDSKAIKLVKDVNVVAVFENIGFLTHDKLEVAGLWCHGVEVDDEDGIPKNSQIIHDDVLRSVVEGVVSCCWEDPLTRDAYDRVLFAWAEGLMIKNVPETKEILKNVITFTPFNPVSKCTVALNVTRRVLPGRKRKWTKKEKGKQTKKNVGKKVIGFARGAPMILLNKCKWIVRYDGTQEELTEEIRDEVRDILQRAGDQGLRFIALASTLFPESFLASKWKNHDWEMELGESEGWCLLGVFILRRPCFDGIEEKIKWLVGMGMKLMLIGQSNSRANEWFAKKVLHWNLDPWSAVPPKKESSDHEDENRPTAIEIPKDQLLDEMPALDWKELLTNRQGVVMNDGHAGDRYNIVRQLHDQGFVVATLGYAPNDMPAIKKADVSFVRLGSGVIPREGATFLSTNEEDNFGAFMQTISVLKQEEGCLLA